MRSKRVRWSSALMSVRAAVRIETTTISRTFVSRGERFGLAFLCGFRALCGLFVVPIPAVCHPVRVYVGLARTADAI
jgi:hypothetical protein